MIKFFSPISEQYSSECSAILDDAADFLLFINSIAGNIIQSCRYDYSWRESNLDRFPDDGALHIIYGEHHDWSTHAFQNVLQSQVQFLFNFADAYVSLPTNRKNQSVFALVDAPTLSLMTLAFTEYQNFKTKICKEDEERHGKGFGSATRYAMMDWTICNSRLNDEILALKHT